MSKVSRFVIIAVGGNWMNEWMNAMFTDVRCYDHTWNTVLARTRSVRCSRAWAFRLPEESISPINAGASWDLTKEQNASCEHKKAAAPSQLPLNFFIMKIALWWLTPDLVFAIVVTLQVLHVKSIIRRTYSAEVERMADLKTFLG